MVRLNEFDISYQPHQVIKAQVLADFIVECTWANEKVGQKGVDKETSYEKTNKEYSGLAWILHMDGASNSFKRILTSPDGVVVEYALWFAFQASNNQAEYEALLARLTIAINLEVKRLKTSMDSQLVVSQTMKEFEAQNPIMTKDLEKYELSYAKSPIF